MLEVRATCVNGGKPETTGVTHDLRELVAEARMTMVKALHGLNRDEELEIEVRSMRQCASCAILFTEFVHPAGWTFLHMHAPPEGLMNA